MRYFEFKGQLMLVLSVFCFATAGWGQTECGDQTACNYGEEGTCEYTSCAGCMDELACNFNGQAHIIKDDGSCKFPEGPCAVCDWLVYGNPNPADGSGQLLSNDVDGDGWCDNTTYAINSAQGQTAGQDDTCTNPNACGYDQLTAGADCAEPVAYYRDQDADGYGEYLIDYFCPSDPAPAMSTTSKFNGTEWDKCADINACNYNLGASGATNSDCDADSDDDGICDGLDNCSDGLSPNYFHSKLDYKNEAYGNVACCTDQDKNGICDDEQIFGCMDANACNYLSIANVDDGKCKFTSTTNAQSDNSDEQYQVDMEDSTCDSCTANGDTISVTPYQKNLLGLPALTVTLGEYLSGDTNSNEVCDNAEQIGCDDPNACNFRWANSSGSLLFDTLRNMYGDVVLHNDSAVFISIPCHWDEDLQMGVDPDGNPCTNYCLEFDECGTCGGTGVDVDQDEVCDSSDNCIDLLACNYSDPTNVACKYYNYCGSCVDGTDEDDNGIVDSSSDDADGDGLCDTDGTDLCYDPSACNWSDPDATQCLTEDACGICGGTGTDTDGDGLCDDVDNCVDTGKCNYNYVTFPENVPCMEDSDGDFVCDPYEVSGCNDAAACNYKSGVTDNLPATCIYADATQCEICSGDLHDGSDHIIIQDSDGDGICDLVDLCSNPAACNFDANPTQACGIDNDGNGVCDVPNHEVLGCNNSSACNYNVSATKNDDSCVYPSGCETCVGNESQDGSGVIQANDADFDGVCDTDGLDLCNDPSACNYIASLHGNTTCLYPDAGLTCDGDCVADVDNDGLCESTNEDQCYDLQACNFNDPSNATCLYHNSCGDCTETTTGVLGYNPDLYCDCEENVLDSLFNCGGGCFTDVDHDGICDDVDPCLEVDEVQDECGRCGGEGRIYECGCFDLPPGACDCDMEGNVRYPAQGARCDSTCIWGTMVVDGVEMCKFFDNAEITEVPTPTANDLATGRTFKDLNNELLNQWLVKFDMLHDRMGSNLDDGALSGASERLTIEEEILSKNRLDVLGDAQLTGFTRMDSDVTILGNLVVLKDLRVLGTTFSLGGIETTSMNMGGDLSVGGRAVIDSTLEVIQTVLLQDSLEVLGPLGIGTNRAFTVDNQSGDATANGEFVILDSLLATDNGTRLNNLVAANTVVTTLHVNDSTLAGDHVQVSGDVDLHQDLSVDLDMTLGGSFDVKGSSTFGHLETASIDNGSQQTSSGSMEVTGATDTPSANVDANSTLVSLDVSTEFTLRGPMEMKNLSQSSIFGLMEESGSVGTLRYAGGLNLYSSTSNLSALSPTLRLEKEGVVRMPLQLISGSIGATAADQTSSLAGDIIVGGLTEVGQGLEVLSGSNSYFEVTSSGITKVKRGPTLHQDLTVISGGSITLSSGYDLTLTSPSTFASLTSTGVSTLTNTGEIAAGPGSFGGDVVTPGSVKSSGTFYAGSSLSSVPSTYIAAFEGPQQTGTLKSNGISITLNHNMPNTGNSFVDFMKKSGGVIGSISGQTEADWNTDAGAEVEAVEHRTKVATKLVSLGIAQKKAAAEAANAIAVTVEEFAPFLPDSWCCTMLLPIGCIVIPIPGFPLPDFGNGPTAFQEITNAVKKAEIATLNVIAKAIGAAEHAAFEIAWEVINRGEWEGGGVMYASGSGDYAEWLPQLRKRQDIHPRQVVGVKGGKITLNTWGADHLMVVSSAPIVAGKMPQADQENVHPVAFMGQVPVDIVGPVAKGDFILPSGDHDGFGRAVHPQDVNLDEVSQILGVAWQAGSDPYFNTINVAVGLDHAQPEHLFTEIEDELDDMSIEIQRLKDRLLHGPDWTPDAEVVEIAEVVAPAVEFDSSMESEAKAQSVASDVVQMPIETPATPGPAENFLPDVPLFNAMNDPEEAKDQYYANYPDIVQEKLKSVSNLKDTRWLENLLGEYREPAVILHSKSQELGVDLVRSMQTRENVKDMLRRHFYNNEEHPNLSSIQPGSQAEQNLVSHVMELLSTSLNDL
ncbi:MAG: hypothetical protein ACPGYK_00965 [Flavobacteriales bacterium]